MIYLYVVQSDDAALQCGFESRNLLWQVYNGEWVNIAYGGDVIDGSKYSTSNNPLTGLYYRLHILNVGGSDLKKYICSGTINGIYQIFYLTLDLLGKNNYALTVLMVAETLYSCLL